MPWSQLELHAGGESQRVGDRGLLREDLAERLRELVEADHRGDAVALFQTEGVVIPVDVVAQLRHAPFWPALEAMAHTLVYETKILGNGSLPTELAASVAVPTLVIAGGESFAYMRETSLALAQIIPDARACVLEGQTHDIAPRALAPVLDDFFAAR